MRGGVRACHGGGGGGGLGLVIRGGSGDEDLGNIVTSQNSSPK